MPLPTPDASRSLYDIDLAYTWEMFNRYKSYSTPSSTRRGFKLYVSKMVRPSYADDVASEVKFCKDCDVPGYQSDMYVGYNPRGKVCYSCRRRYRRCEQCGVTFNSRFEHVHTTNACCSSSQRVFTIPNEGSVLANDTRVKVSLPSGQISEEGMSQIHAYLNNCAYNRLNEMSRSSRDTTQYYAEIHAFEQVIKRLSRAWQTKEGNFSKRLSRLLYNEFQVKISAEELSHVGNVARDHSKGVDYFIEITRELNQSAASFAHAGSCWWSSYSRSRCILKTMGGFGIRSYDSMDARTPTGRVWVMPLKYTTTSGGRKTKNLTQTYNALSPDAYVVFNGYGAMDGYSPARILAQLTGSTYRKLESLGVDNMYVNGGGYLVGCEENISPWTDKTLRLTGTVHSSLWNDEAPDRALRAAAQIAETAPAVAAALTDSAVATSTTAESLIRLGELLHA